MKSSLVVTAGLGLPVPAQVGQNKAQFPVISWKAKLVDKRGHDLCEAMPVRGSWDGNKLRCGFVITATEPITIFPTHVLLYGVIDGHSLPPKRLPLSNSLTAFRLGKGDTVTVEFNIHIS